MPLVPTVIISMKDQKGKTSTTKIHLEPGFSFATLVAAGEALAQIIANLSTAQITEVNVSVGLDLSLADLKIVATGTADWFKKAAIYAMDTVTQTLTKFFIPTYAETNTLINSDVLDPSDAQVVALETIIEDGVDDGGIGIYVVTARDQNVDLVTGMVEMFRKS